MCGSLPDYSVKVHSVKQNGNFKHLVQNMKTQFLKIHCHLHLKKSKLQLWALSWTAAFSSVNCPFWLTAHPSSSFPIIASLRGSFLITFFFGVISISEKSWEKSHSTTVVWIALGMWPHLESCYSLTLVAMHTWDNFRTIPLSLQKKLHSPSIFILTLTESPVSFSLPPSYTNKRTSHRSACCLVTRIQNTYHSYFQLKYHFYEIAEKTT